jgi:S-adenosylmethionine synthetase
MAEIGSKRDLYGVPVAILGDIATEITVPGIIEARCLLLSRIGTRVDAPALAEVCVRTRAGRRLKELSSDVENVLERRLEALADLWRESV